MLVGSLVACGGSGDSGGGDSQVPVFGEVVITDVPVAFALATCSYAYRCCTDPEINLPYVSSDAPVTTEAECDTANAASAQMYTLPRLLAGLAAGRMIFDAAAAGRCANEIANLPCGGPAANVARTCEPFIIPLVAAGSGCILNEECVSGNCDQRGVTNANDDGVCSTPPTAGMPCSSVCAAGLSCELGGSGNACAPVAAPGEACTDGTACDTGACDTGASYVCIETCTGRH